MHLYQLSFPQLPIGRAGVYAGTVLQGVIYLTLKLPLVGHTYLHTPTRWTHVP